MKKYAKSTLWIIPFLAIASFLHAEYKTYENNYKPIFSDDLTHPRENVPTAITPNAGPRVLDGYDVFLTADFIYWKISQDGTSYVMNGFADGLGFVPLSKGSVQNIDFDFEPGFKVGLGFSLGRDGWDLYTEYTWLNSHPNSKSTSMSQRSFLFPLWNIGALFQSYSELNTDEFLSAKGEWDLTFNVIDMELGRNYFISQYLKLRPFIGFKGAFVDQDLDVTYKMFDFSVANENQTLKMDNDQNTWGFGLRTGLNTSWQLDNAFSIYGDFAMTALWGKYELDRKDTSKTPDSSSDTSVLFHTKSEFFTIKPVLELGLGMRYDLWFMCDRYHFDASLGWEQQIWMDFNQLIKIKEESAHGDFTTQGLTLKLRFDF